MKTLVIFSLLFYFGAVHLTSVLEEVENEEFIRCLYTGGSDNEDYKCIMTVQNPNQIEFESIDGDHLPNFENNDVRDVDVSSGTSKIIPTVICRQFPNVSRLSVSGIDVEIVTPDTFSECRNLVNLFLTFNDIQTIPANTFSNNPILEYLELSRNKIAELNENSFTGTALNFIAIDYNKLTTFNQNWFTSINGTLRHLELMQNEITTLEAEAFSNLRQLTNLYLNYNQLSNISPSAFDGLESLDILSLTSTGIKSLNPKWFEALPTLRVFYAQLNEITVLANNTFDPLVNLQELYLNSNRIRVLSRGAFGSSIANLRTFYLSDNRVNIIEPLWVDDAQRLEFLLLAGNLCIDEDFINVPAIRWRILETLQQCTNNFQLPPYIGCTYEQLDDNYICRLNIHNPNGFDEFESISGDHLDGKSNTDVTKITAAYGNSRILPSILCRTFENLKYMSIELSNLEDLNENHLKECKNLEELLLHNNWISVLPDFSFRSLEKLKTLNLESNFIFELTENSFSGSKLEALLLSSNRLNRFEPAWIKTISSTLKALTLGSNGIGILKSGDFDNLINLETLSLKQNPFWDIPSNIFDPLVNLIELNINDCQINSLNPLWFQKLQKLNTLDIDNNKIEVFPDGIFNSLVSLTSLYFSNNNLRELNADSFGESLKTIIELYGVQNRIRSFDPRIIKEASKLDTMFLNDNVCTDGAFLSIQLNMEIFLGYLAKCFSNFGPETISCRYSQLGDDYTCSLSIFNPMGRDSFELVNGTHIEGRSNNDVIGVYVSDGRTLNIPQILCQTFKNLQSMDFVSDEIEYVEVGTFSNCRSLKRLYVYDNLIQSLPSGLFENNDQLEEVNFGRNRLTASGIPVNIFTGTVLNILELSSNPIADFNSDWIIPVASTLKQLNLRSIEATHLPVLFFDTESILETLDLSGNLFTEIVPVVFDRLPTLKNLDLSSCQFRTIDPNWLRSLKELEVLRLSSNGILNLPENAFTALEKLEWLYIDGNRLRELKVNTFGVMGSQVHTIFAQNNEIVGIEPEFLESLNKLNVLYLVGNRCNNENFYDIRDNITTVRESLDECATNFNAETISCDYGMEGELIYRCSMKTFNPLGRNNFERIEGEHMSEKGNEDVKSVDIIDQDTRIVPSVICRQFPNMDYLVVSGSHLNYFDEGTLSGCPNLKTLYILWNDIFELPNYSFLGNPKLELLVLSNNQLTSLNEFTLSGTSVTYLYLDNNNLGSFNPLWFETLNGTLQELDLSNNNIQSLPSRGFMNLGSLKQLRLSNNPLNNNLESKIFDGLDTLNVLFLDNCQLSYLDPSWFRALANVEILHLEDNRIDKLPPNIFDSFRNIHGIYLTNNFIWEINADQFGRSLRSLHYKF